MLPSTAVRRARVYTCPPLTNTRTSPGACRRYCKPFEQADAELVGQLNVAEATMASQAQAIAAKTYQVAAGAAQVQILSEALDTHFPLRTDHVSIG